MQAVAAESTGCAENSTAAAFWRVSLNFKNSFDRMFKSFLTRNELVDS